MLLIACSVAGSPSPVGAAGTGGAVPDRVATGADEVERDGGQVGQPEGRTVRLRLGRQGRLRIGTLPVFDYDGRLGGGLGRMVDLGGGRWGVTFEGSAVDVPPLPMIPGRPDLPLRVRITTRELHGTLDVCSGSLALDFDARFQPEAFGAFPPALSVVTPLSTGTVGTGAHALVGAPLDAFGRATLVGVAPVPRTGDRLVDALLGLPAPATAELVADLDVDGGLPACPGAAAPEPRMRMEIGPRSQLSIGRFAPFTYDGGSEPMTVPLVPLDGRLHFELDPSTVRIPPARPLPGFDGVQIRVRPRRMSGDIDPCTGEVTLSFDATFTGWVFGARTRALRAATTLTTATSSWHGRTVAGSPLDGFGSARLVGVAPVAGSGDAVLDAFVGLPSAAVAELDAHLDLLGVTCAA